LWVDVFGALADPVRRALLEELAAGPARVGDLAARHPISRPAVSKHLRLLAQAGLVTAAEVGRERHYSLAPSALLPVVELLARLGAPAARPTGPLTDRALDALETEVRRTVRDRRTRRTGADGPREETA
jgi:DNA-binding transcriptional ArsR family regulator